MKSNQDNQTDLQMIDTFAGSGGASYAAHNLIDGGITTKQFVEIDPDAQMVLRDRFGKDISLHGDIKTFHCEPGDYDLVWSSFPCTGTSLAGNKAGLSHPKSSLWKEGVRLLIESNAKFGIIEQPCGVINNGLRAILGGLRVGGYNSEIEVVSATELGSGQVRARVFIVSYLDCWSSIISRYATPWTGQIRDLVERQSDRSSWLTVERRGDGSDYGISPRSLQMSVPPRTPGRIRARYLAGRTVTPLQASIPLIRVKYLNRVVNKYV